MSEKHPATTSPLPEWPNEPEWNPLNPQRSQALATNYHARRADAWEARCRLAVEALHDISCNTGKDRRKVANDALESIGPLPGDGG